MVQTLPRILIQWMVMSTLWGVTRGGKLLLFHIRAFRVDHIMQLSCSMLPTEAAAIQDLTRPKPLQLRFPLRYITMLTVFIKISLRLLLF